jgi:hypothetical protein
MKGKKIIMGHAQEVTLRIIEMIKDYDENLLETRPAPGEIIINSSEEGYDIKDYVADIVQFLSCKDVINILQ